MKKVEAIIKPFNLDEVRDALRLVGIDRMTATEVKVFDPHRHTSCYRGVEYAVWFLQIKLEILIDDEQVADCVGVIARTARFSDSTIGEVTVSPTDRIRIRTGEPLKEHPARQPLYRRGRTSTLRAVLG